MRENTSERGFALQTLIVAAVLVLTAFTAGSIVLSQTDFQLPWLGARDTSSDFHDISEEEWRDRGISAVPREWLVNTDRSSEYYNEHYDRRCPMIRTEFDGETRGYKAECISLRSR